MASVTLPHLSSSIRRLLTTALSLLLRGVTWPKSGRRLQRRRRMQPLPHWKQQHFGSLDDQLLNDLGLQRSEIRAAEYGILPGDQALHHEEDELSRESEMGGAGPQLRSGA